MHCNLTLEQAAELAQLDPHDVAWSCEEFGRCDSDDYIITPNGEHYVVKRRCLPAVQAKEAPAVALPAKPWVAQAIAAGRSVPAWIAERAATREEFERLLSLRERAFPKVR